MAGLTNAEYANWLNNTASIDCGDVTELYIKKSNGQSNTITDSAQICSTMSNATESQVANINVVKFTGEDWSALDERLTTNLERVDNDGEVPLNIKRPPGG